MCLNRLPEALKVRLEELQLMVPDHPLIKAVTDVLVGYQPTEVPQMWLAGDALYLAFLGVYVQFDRFPEGIRADCFLDSTEEMDTYWDALSVAKWLRRAFKTR